MANRPINENTLEAVAMLVQNKPLNVFDEWSFTGISEADLAVVMADPSVAGVWNVASDIANPDSTHDVVFHQIRFLNAVDAVLRPTWAQVDAAEIQVAADRLAAENKRLAIYTEQAAKVASLVGLLLSELTSVQLEAFLAFQSYMGVYGFVNGRGRIYTRLAAQDAPIEYKIILDGDLTGYWNIGSLNPQWADFMAACGVETNPVWNFSVADPCWTLTGNIGFGSGVLYAGGGSASGGGVATRKFLTTPGTTYNLTFTAARAGSGGNINLKTEVLDDQTGATLLNTTDPIGTYTKQFTATRAISVLRFTDVSTGSPSADLMIDNVSVVGV